MTDLDSLFDHLRVGPAPDGLAAIESRVFAGMALQRERAMLRWGLMLAVAISLVIGVSTSLIPVSEAHAGSLFGVPADAPSHLLVR